MLVPWFALFIVLLNHLSTFPECDATKTSTTKDEIELAFHEALKAAGRSPAQLYPTRLAPLISSGPGKNILRSICKNVLSRSLVPSEHDVSIAEVKIRFASKSLSSKTPQDTQFVVCPLKNQPSYYIRESETEDAKGSKSYYVASDKDKEKYFYFEYEAEIKASIEGDGTVSSAGSESGENSGESSSKKKPKKQKSFRNKGVPTAEITMAPSSRSSEHGAATQCLLVILGILTPIIYYFTFH